MLIIGNSFYVLCREHQQCISYVLVLHHYGCEYVARKEKKPKTSKYYYHVINR